MKYKITTRQPITVDGVKIPGETPIATIESDVSPTVLCQMIKAGQVSVLGKSDESDDSGELKTEPDAKPDLKPDAKPDAKPVANKKPAK